MKCHFCDETLKEGELICHNCKSMVIDFNYMKHLREIENKYSKRDFLELSKEKLTFPEIVTILTFIKRSDRHAGDTYMQDKCREDGTCSNLHKRLEEIRNETDNI